MMYTTRPQALSLQAKERMLGNYICVCDSINNTCTCSKVTTYFNDAERERERDRERAGERERERDRERERETQRARKRDTARQTERERERKKERDRERETQKDRERERDGEKERETLKSVVTLLTSASAVVFKQTVQPM